jgi:aspartyl-tRNA(Asn)/glutamyl-tRNA(Gln) amidotransferase subunit A
MSERITVADCAADLRNGKTTAQELTARAMARIQDPQGEGAKVFTRVYREAATASAQASDALRKAGLARSAIDGIPVSIKDLFDVKGETTLAGSVVLKDAPPASESALVVRRLIAAGAVIVGRTNMTEFAYSGLGLNPHYGTPRNAWDRKTGRIPGGSSSGAVVSVSDGMAVAGIGTDTGGSVRIPAALNGLVGFKPTARRVPMEGVLPLSANLDSVGPIAPSVACCAALDKILSGEESEGALLPAPLDGLRLALPTTVVLDAMDTHVADAFAKSVAKLSAAGAKIVELPIQAFARLAQINAKGGFTAAEAWAWHKDLIARSAEKYDPRVVSRIRRGQEMSAADFIDLMKARTTWIGEVRDMTSSYDALILPTLPIIAPALDELAASDDAYFKANGLILRNPTVINFMDGCALSIPCHRPGDAPVGLMLAGHAMSDAKILSIGLAIESLFAKG